ncbi:MAG: ABC transporter permease [Dermatophilaceae bacterium]
MTEPSAVTNEHSGAPSPPADQESPTAAPSAARTSTLRMRLEQNALLILLVLVIVFFAILPASRATFVSPANLSVLLGNQSTVALLSLAVILPLVSGYFDFSVGAIAATSTVLSAGLMSRNGTPLWLAILICLVIGVAVGGVNGLLVTRYGLNSFVTTLGMATLLGGIIQWYTGGQTILTGISPALIAFGSETWFGLPKVVYVVIVVAILLWFMFTHTPYGRSLYAIGANPRSAQLVGIRVNKYVLISFMLAGLLSAITGVLQLARFGSATADSGNSLLFPALAAAFLGATSVRPGFFNVVGTMIGLLFVAVSVSGLTLAGAQAWVSPVFNGAALLAAVGLSTYLGRKRGASR